MTSYIVRRLAHVFLTVLAVSMLVFVLLQLSGDPATALLPMEATAADVANLRAELGLNRPLPEQYLLFLGRAIHGDFGFSYRHREGAMSIVIERMPATLKLAGAALLVSLVLAIPLGMLGAWRRGSWIDQAAMMVAVTGQSMPTFWMGLMLILIVAVTFRWLPASGGGDARSLILPAVTLGANMAGITARLLRSSLLEVLSKDYIRVARAKGLVERAVLSHHALRNAALPVVTMIGLQLAYLLAGAIVVETVFAYPGMGLLVIQAITAHDFPVVQAFVLVFTTMIVLVNLVVDLLYTRLDPRIAY
ncbi:MAG TPA: ABC transporter permease [bacterium]|nr:ABC transporter permease [bacterium]